MKLATPTLAAIALVLITGCSAGPAGSAAAAPQTQATPPTGGPTATPTTAAGPASAGGAVEPCTILDAAEVAAIVGSPVTPSKASAVCTLTGPNGSVLVTIKTVDPGRQSQGMDVIVQGGPPWQAIQGLGDKAIAATPDSGATIVALRGTTVVQVGVTVTGKSGSDLLDTAKKLTTEILAKI